MAQNEPITLGSLAKQFGWTIYVSMITFACQIYVFEWKWDLVAFSVLIGTSCGLAGGLAGLLASPEGADDQERLSKVSTAIATLFTGYILAKVFDPLIAEAFKMPAEFFKVKNSANLFVALIGFISGFLATYQFRAYTSGKLKEVKPPTDIPQAATPPNTPTATATIPDTNKDAIPEIKD